MLSRRDRSALLVIDIQPPFLAPIVDAERVVRRSEFLIRVARLLEVPIFVTEQYPSRMGETESRVREAAQNCPIEGKMVFSCFGCAGLQPWLTQIHRDQIVLVGIETPICVTQTALQLVERGYEVFLAEDAVSARSESAHRMAMERMVRAGAIGSQTESVVYEWLESAEHPQFRDVLKLVKELNA